MKKIFKYVLIVLAVILIAAQFIRPDLSNPPTAAGQDIEASIAIPTDVRATLKRSCSDCHTNTTTYPWYSQITPVSWWLQDHISEGRHELNFSEWGTYSDRKKSKKLEEICEQVESREMPLPSYTWAHWDAPLSEAEITSLCEWTKVEQAKIPAAE